MWVDWNNWNSIWIGCQQLKLMLEHWKLLMKDCLVCIVYQMHVLAILNKWNTSEMIMYGLWINLKWNEIYINWYEYEFAWNYKWIEGE